METLKVFKSGVKSLRIRILLAFLRDFFVTFDSKFYREISNSRFAFFLPRLHFFIYGQNALLSPSPFFDPLEYTSIFPVTEAKKKMSFFHYLAKSTGYHPITRWDFSYLKFAPEASSYDRSLLLHMKLHRQDYCSEFSGPSVGKFSFNSEVINHGESVLLLATNSLETEESVIRDPINIVISNCQKTVISSDKKFLRKNILKLSFNRIHHLHEDVFESARLTVKFHSSTEIFIEAHQPTLLDYLYISDVLTSKLSLQGKEQSIEMSLRNSASRSKYIASADSLNEVSFQLLAEDLCEELKKEIFPQVTKLVTKSMKHKKVNRILIVSHEDSITGAPIYILQVAQSLLEYGYEVHVVSLRDEFKSGNFAMLGHRHSYLQDHLNSDSRNARCMTNWLLSSAGESAMKSLLQRFDPEMILVNSLASCEAVRVAHSCQIPTIMYVHEAWSFEESDWMTRDSFRIRVKQSLEAAQLVFFGSETTYKHWSGAGFAINAKTLPSYRSTAILEGNHRQNARLALREKLQIGINDYVFLSVATFEPRKRIADIVRAFQLLTHQNISLLLVGSSDSPNFKVVAGLIGNDPRIKSIPATKDINPYYAAADCLVFASDEETMPLVLQEAALWSIPRIVSRYSGYHELVPSSEFALLFPIHDVKELAQQMRLIMSDEFDSSSLISNSKLLQQENLRSGLQELISGIDSVSESWSTVIPSGWLFEED